MKTPRRRIRTAATALALVWSCSSGDGDERSNSGPPPDPGDPTAAISIDAVPRYGSNDDVAGRGLEPERFRVAVYVKTQTWWSKPTAGSPTVPIAVDGSWTADVTTDGGAGCDPWSTRLLACLIPQEEEPPIATGLAELPAAVRDGRYECVEVTRGPAERTLQFSGRTWRAKHFDCPAGPGPNLFSGAAEHVWTDDDGALHLNISRVDGRWTSSEVVLEASLGYGRYVFVVRGRTDQLDPAAVLGLFTWDPFAPPPNREMDIEYSRWSDPDDEQNAQFVVQPFSSPGHRERFRVEPNVDDPVTTNVIDWAPGVARFAVHAGRLDSSELDAAIPSRTWTFQGDGVPSPGRESARINLWLFRGEPPPSGNRQEVVIERFDFEPASQ